MLNFVYSIPTRIFFGRNQIESLPEQVKRYGTSVLLVYGGGSIKKSGLYDKIIELFQVCGISYWELPGVEPNPKIASVRKGIEICRTNGIELILAVGGGSAIDCAKAVGAGFYYEGDAWDIVADPRKITKVLPIACVLTISATGSEMDAGAVISNPETKEKLGTGHKDMAPRFSILDPTYTFSVPKNQTAAGTADIMSHVFEVYFSKTKKAYLQDRMAEAVLKTCIHYGPKALEEPDNYEARANLMWASSLAINGLLSYGKETEWTVHAMEHELSAFYDITHGIGLAILTPNWMEYALNEQTVDKFVEYAANVWMIEVGEDKFAVARLAIQRTSEFFMGLGLPSSLHEIGITDDKFVVMAQQATRKWKLGHFKPLEMQDVLNIYKASL